MKDFSFYLRCSNRRSRCAYGDELWRTVKADYKKGFTIDHYFEERVGVDYRFFKNFTGLYSDENGKEKRVTFKMYVRKLEKNVYTAIHPLMDKEMIKKGAYKKYFINNIHFSLIDINIAGKIMLKDLKSGGGLIYPKKLNS